MRIWIDLSNSPHPLLFAPIARRLQELGHDIGVTARDNAQTVELTLQRWPDATIIGGASPKSRIRKARVMVQRIRMLTQWARSFHPDIALSHNSYGQIVAARTLGLRVVTAMDYEGQPANHFGFRLAHVILMPEALRGSRVRAQGAADRRTHFYPGYKEEVYLGDFEPNPDVLASIGLELSEAPLVVARSPPTRAAYHQFGNPLFAQILEAFGGDTNTRIVVLVRHPEQRRQIEELRLTNIVVPNHAVDSRSLIYHADLVIGAGGTMTREAALIGVPTYSIFAGPQPKVDRALEREGKLQRLQSAPHKLIPVARRDTEPRTVNDLRERATALVSTFVNATLASTEH